MEIKHTIKKSNKIIEVEPYYAFPCKLQTFSIDGKDANQYDFGRNRDHDLWNAEPYGCACNKFERIDNPSEISETMKRYSLTREEFDEICSILENVLYVGCCGWCV